MSRGGFIRIWRGEIGLYRAAFGLGGIGMTLVFLFGDSLAAIIASVSSVAGEAAYIICAAAELAFAWVVSVATWRAARRRRPSGRPYSPIGIAIAFLFAGTQLIFTVAWTVWSGLAALGVVPDLDRAILYAFGAGSDANSTNIEDLSKILGELGH